MCKTKLILQILLTLSRLQCLWKCRAELSCASVRLYDEATALRGYDSTRLELTVSFLDSLALGATLHYIRYSFRTFQVFTLIQWPRGTRLQLSSFELFYTPVETLLQLLLRYYDAGYNVLILLSIQIPTFNIKILAIFRIIFNK